MSNNHVTNDRVLSIEVTDDEAGRARHHFNIDNISFVTIAEMEPTRAGAGVALLLGIASIWILLKLFDGWLPWVVGIVVFIVVLGLLLMEWQEIGTVADTFSIDEGELRGDQGVEEQLLDLAPELISVNDREQHYLYTKEYRHYFLPQNVVSVKETSRMPLVKIILIFVVFPIVALYGGIEYGVPIINGFFLSTHGLPSIEHFLMTAVYIAVVIAPILYVISQIGDIIKLEINTPAGDDHTFEVSESDAERVLSGLQSRDEERVTAETRRS